MLTGQRLSAHPNEGKRATNILNNKFLATFLPPETNEILALLKKKHKVSK